MGPFISDKEAGEIARQRREGISGGPLVLKWVDRLLADRQARVEQLRYLHRRLRQAFRYLDALIANGGELRRPYSAPTSSRFERADPVVCPVCREPYARASGMSPRGVAFEHRDGKQCRTG